MTEPGDLPKNILPAKNFVTIEGVTHQVMARQLARLPVPHAQTEDGLVWTRGIHQVLLDNGKTIFQCYHLNEPACTYIHENGVSVRTHLRTHSDRMMAQRHAARIQLLASENERLANAAAEKAARYSRGAKQGWETRRAKAETNSGTEDNTQGEDMTEQTPVSMDELRKRLNEFGGNIEALFEGLGRLSVMVGNVTVGLKEFMEEIDKLADSEFENETPDPEILAKAEKWDAIRGLLDG